MLSNVVTLDLHPKFRLMHCQRVVPAVPISCLLNLFPPYNITGFPNNDTPNSISSKN